MCKIMEDYRQEGVNKTLLEEQKKRVKVLCDVGVSLERITELCSDIPRNVIDSAYNLFNNNTIDM